MIINFPANRVLKALTLVTIVIFVINVLEIIFGEVSWQITRLFNVGFESNFPTWFASFMFIIAAAYAHECGRLAQDKVRERRTWRILAAGLLLMSCDEVAMMHENLGYAITKWLFTGAKWHSAWIVTLGPIALLALIMFAVRLAHYLKGSGKAIKFLLAGAVVYVFGAFLLEATINLLNHETLEWLWRIENVVEETSELVGVILVIKGLAAHEEFLCGNLGQGHSSPGQEKKYAN